RATGLVHHQIGHRDSERIGGCRRVLEGDGIPGAHAPGNCLAGNRDAVFVDQANGDRGRTCAQDGVVWLVADDGLEKATASDIQERVTGAGCTAYVIRIGYGKRAGATRDLDGAVVRSRDWNVAGKRDHHRGAVARRERHAALIDSWYRTSL